MKLLYIILILLFFACNDSQKKDELTQVATTTQITEKVITENLQFKTYPNERFRNVVVESLGENKFKIHGEAQVFEATLNWIVEDGHQELLKGFQTSSAGAPEWGKFDFTIEAIKKQENSTLTLYLFEISAKDGSRQFELPLFLY